MHELRRIVGFLGPYRRDAILGMLLVVIESAFEMVIPILMADIIDVGVATRDLDFIFRQASSTHVTPPALRMASAHGFAPRSTSTCRR